MEAFERGEEMSHTDPAGKGAPVGGKRGQSSEAAVGQPFWGASMEAQQAKEDTGVWLEGARSPGTSSVRTLTMP